MIFDETQFRLDSFGTNLVNAPRSNKFVPLLFRDEAVARAVTYLRRKRSVLIVGGQSAGKTAIVHGVASCQRDTGAGLRQLSTSDFISGTRFIGEWQTKVRVILDRAQKRRVILYITDPLNFLTVGTTVSDDSALIDAIAPRVTSGDVLSGRRTVLSPPEFCTILCAHIDAHATSVAAPTDG